MHYTVTEDLIRVTLAVRRLQDDLYTHDTGDGRIYPDRSLMPAADDAPAWDELSPSARRGVLARYVDWYGFSPSDVDGVIDAIAAGKDTRAWFDSVEGLGPETKGQWLAALDIEQVMTEGTANSVPYAELSRRDKLELLDFAIDWTDYATRGMEPDTAWVMIFNAVDGKPPGRWLEQTPEEASARKSELDGYARQFDEACERIRDSQKGRELTFEQHLQQTSDQARLAEPDKGREPDLERD